MIDQEDEDFNLDDMIPAVWEETRETDCSKLAEIIVNRIPAGMIMGVLIDVMAEYCQAVLSGEGQPRRRLDPVEADRAVRDIRLFYEAMEATAHNAGDRREACSNLMAMINAEPATSFHQVLLDTNESDPGKAAHEIISRMSESVRQALDANGVIERLIEVIADAYSAFVTGQQHGTWDHPGPDTNYVGRPR